MIDSTVEENTINGHQTNPTLVFFRQIWHKYLKQLAVEQRILLWDYLKLCPFSSQISLNLILLSVVHIFFFRFSDALRILTCDIPQSKQRIQCLNRTSTSGKFKKTICYENLRMQNLFFFKILNLMYLYVLFFQNNCVSLQSKSIKKKSILKLTDLIFILECFRGKISK